MQGSSTRWCWSALAAGLSYGVPNHGTSRVRSWINRSSRKRRNTSGSEFPRRRSCSASVPAAQRATRGRELVGSREPSAGPGRCRAHDVRAPGGMFDDAGQVAVKPVDARGAPVRGPRTVPAATGGPADDRLGPIQVPVHGARGRDDPRGGGNRACRRWPKRRRRPGARSRASSC